jgi:hypothetical protein
MSSFVYNLINRHTLMDNLVKPRARSMFEPENLNTGDHVANEFISDSVATTGIKSLSSRTQSPVNTSGEQKGENSDYQNVIPPRHKDDDLNHLEQVVLNDPGAALKKEGNKLRPEEPASYQKINFHIEKQAESADKTKTYLNLNRSPGEVGNAIRRETEPAASIENVNNGKIPELTKHIDKDIASNKYKDVTSPDTQSIVNPGQSIVSEQTNNVYQKEGTLIGNYNSSAFINRAAPAINIQQPASKKAAIKISIGQIDVRAIAEVQPVLPRNKSVPVARMSLDDYLKIRNSSEK